MRIDMHVIILMCLVLKNRDSRWEDVSFLVIINHNNYTSKYIIPRSIKYHRSASQVERRVQDNIGSVSGRSDFDRATLMKSERRAVD